MPIRKLASSLWATWKYVVILGCALCASVAMNLSQWKAKGVAKERARADAFAEALKTTAGIAVGAQKDNTGLLADLEAIAERGRKTRTIYRDAVKTPLPAQCAPGQERIDAVNAGADEAERNSAISDLAEDLADMQCELYPSTCKGGTP